jgi:hypothetical protein
MFKVTYEDQLVSTDLDLNEATQLAEELNSEALQDNCEPLYQVEQQASFEVTQ